MFSYPVMTRKAETFHEALNFLHLNRHRARNTSAHENKTEFRCTFLALSSSWNHLEIGSRTIFERCLNLSVRRGAYPSPRVRNSSNFPSIDTWTRFLEKTGIFFWVE